MKEIARRERVRRSILICNFFFKFDLCLATRSSVANKLNLTEILITNYQLQLRHATPGRVAELCRREGGGRDGDKYRY